MPKANLTRWNSITDNYQPHPIEVLFLVMAEYAKVMKPIPNYIKGSNNVPVGMAIVGEQGKELILSKGEELIIDQHGNRSIIKYDQPDQFGNVFKKGCFDKSLNIKRP